MVDTTDNRPKVSVIMNCLNCSKYLIEAIDCVYAQTYKDWEIIFWDNASTDSSAEMAKRYDERLRYFRGDETVPLYAARNYALRQAQGEFIAFLDCDDLWLPTKLEKQIGLFSNEKVGIVFSNTFFLNQKTKADKILYKEKPPAGMIFRQLLGGYFLSLETVVIRRACLDQLSELFDERFHHVGDADLFLRIAFGWEAAYVDEPLAKWRMHAESGTWKKPEIFGHEWKMILVKYRNLFTDFDSEYYHEIRRVKAIAAYYEALGEWKEGRTANVREIIRPHIPDKPKLLAVYLLSVLPYRYYVTLLRLMGRHA
ncbi:MAG: glycosyltransferase [Nitrospirae bacterium]|nr:glycosyltransferase [Nitrospirota bacterium]